MSKLITKDAYLVAVRIDSRNCWSPAHSCVFLSEEGECGTEDHACFDHEFPADHPFNKRRSDKAIIWIKRT